MFAFDAPIVTEIAPEVFRGSQQAGPLANYVPYTKRTDEDAGDHARIELHRRWGTRTPRPGRYHA